VTPAEQYTVWLAEIVSENESILEKLPAAREALQIAEPARDAARTTWRELETFAARKTMVTDAGISGPLYSRLMGAREALKTAEGIWATAHRLVESLEQQSATRRAAIAEIDYALNVGPEAKGWPDPKNRPIGNARPRKPRAASPVDFDTIQMPREAV
jgi:hypothetical protein